MWQLSQSFAQLTVGSLTARLESFDPPAELLAGRPMIFRVIEPAFADTSQRTVVLPNGALVDTIATGPGGTPTPFVTLQRRPGFTAPDSAVASASSRHGGGTPAGR